VGTDGTGLAGGGIFNDGSVSGCPATTSSIPSTASGVHSDTRIAFATYLLGIFNLASLTAEGHFLAPTEASRSHNGRGWPRHSRRLAR
jgi:hypothetical protein